LGAIRFYNSLLLYSREIKSGTLGDFVVAISIDDSQASRIRNVLAHNFCPINHIKSDTEKILFKLGERIIDICNGVKVQVPIISLAKSIFWLMEVRIWNSSIN